MLTPRLETELCSVLHVYANSRISPEMSEYQTRQTRGDAHTYTVTLDPPTDTYIHNWETNTQGRVQQLRTLDPGQTDTHTHR